MATFGITTPGASIASAGSGSVNFLDLNGPYSMPGGGVTRISAYLAAIGNGMQVRMVIYADNNGSPGALMAVSNQAVPTVTTPGWIDFTFASNPTLSSGSYWIGYWFGAQITGGGLSVYYDAVANSEKFLGSVNYSPTTNPPNPWPGGGGTSNSRYSVYVTYTPGNVDLGTISLVLTPSFSEVYAHGQFINQTSGVGAGSIFGAGGSIGPVFGQQAGVASGVLFGQGGSLTQSLVEVGIVSLVFTPSRLEDTTGGNTYTDLGTSQFKLSPSAIEVLSSPDSGTVTLSLGVSFTEARGFTEVGTVGFGLVPSAIETAQTNSDNAIAYFSLAVSATEVQERIDITEVYFDIIPKFVGSAQYVDNGFGAYLDIVPSSVELAALIDSATARVSFYFEAFFGILIRLSFTPSGTEVGATNDSGIEVFTFKPSFTEGLESLVSGQLNFSLLPSGIDVTTFVPEVITFLLKFTPSTFQEGLGRVDSSIQYLRLVPSAVEEFAVNTEEAIVTLRLQFTLSAEEIEYAVDVGTYRLKFTVSSVDLPIYADSGLIYEDLQVSSIEEWAAVLDAGTLILLFSVTEATESGLVDGAEVYLVFTPENARIGIGIVHMEGGGVATVFIQKTGGGVSSLVGGGDMPGLAIFGREAPMLLSVGSW